MNLIRFMHPKHPIDFARRFPAAAVVAASFVTFSVICLFAVGVNWGIDFLGGTEMQVQFPQPVNSQDIRETLQSIGLEKNQVQRYGSSSNNEMLIRIQRLSSVSPQELEHLQKQLNQHFASLIDGKTILVQQPTNAVDRLLISIPAPARLQQQAQNQRQLTLKDQKQALLKLLQENKNIHLRSHSGQNSVDQAIEQEDRPAQSQVIYNVRIEGISRRIHQALSKQFGDVVVRRVEFVDNQVSKQLRTDGLLAVVYALLAILVYIAVRFDMLFAPGAIVGLLHDALGVFLIFTIGGMEFNLPCVAALLTIVGYSINNTIVVYDRIREAVPASERRHIPHEQLVQHINKALTDTLSRTINTSLTTLFASVALWVWAGGAIAVFALALSLGIILGGFSTTFVAPAVYLKLHKWTLKRSQTTASAKPQEESTQQERLSREDKLRGVV
ncbi:MAG: protein translocase subunit SecF [Myxococcota bacterium]